MSYGDMQLRGEDAGGNGFSFTETFNSTSFVPDDGDDDDQGEDEG